MRNSRSHSVEDIFLSVQLEVTLSRPQWVSTRPWLAFQPKAMLKSDRWYQVSDVVGKVSDGVGKVSDGAGKVSDGVEKVSDGVGKVIYGGGKV